MNLTKEMIEELVKNLNKEKGGVWDVYMNPDDRRRAMTNTDLTLTTKRFAHVRQFVLIRERVAENPAQADDIIYQAILETLPPQYRNVQRFVKSHRGNISSSMVSTAFRIAQNHAASILNELWQFGLLDREADVGENGKRYLYR